MIDTELFVSRGKFLRKIEREVLLQANPTKVFDAWTHSETLAVFLGVEAHVELEIGGAMELYFLGADEAEPGKRGSEGCQILSYIPDELLSFSWNAPPHLASEREKKTWVALRFDPCGAEGSAGRGPSFPGRAPRKI